MVKRLAGLLTGMLLLVLLFAPRAEVEARSLRIEALRIEAAVDQHGDLLITEWDTYEFEGSYNGILVALDSAGSQGIEGFQAFEVRDGQERPLQVERSVAGTKETYKVYAASTDERKQFRFTYRVNQAVQVYADTAELYWKFFDQANETQLELVTIDLQLPGSVPKAEMLAFGHGPLNGSLEVWEGGLVTYRVSPLDPGELLEARVLFPPAYVPGSKRVSDQPALDRIKAEEFRWADAADQRRAATDAAARRFPYIAAGLLLANLAACVALYFRHDREYRPEWEGPYYRELPAEVSPAVMSYLLSYSIGSKDLMATLMDLVRRQHVELETYQTEGGFLKRKQTDYRFRLTNRGRKHLRPHEVDLIDWLFHDLGPGGEITLQAMRQAAEQKKSALHFVSRFERWTKKAEAEARAMGWFEPNAGQRIAVLLFVVQFLGFLFLAPGPLKVLALAGMPLFLYGMKIRRRTRIGATEHAKWQALKRFLTDYSRLAERDPLSVHLWEQYLVYGISLGVAKKVIAISQMNLHRPDDRNYPLYHAVTANRFDHDFDHIANSFHRSVSTAMSNSSSSSRGSGGGFSSGGGGGGGGGGRGGF